MMDMTRVRPRTFRMISYVAVAGVAFQIAHFIEHIAQAAYWMMHPLDQPWLTPWAVTGRDLLAAGGNTVTGTELLHLVGNALFFFAIMAICVLAACKDQPAGSVRGLKAALWIQGYHVVEHVALTGTFLIFGKAIGVSTAFGLVGPGPLMWSYRVWFHFAINLAATIYATRAIRDMYGKGNLIPDLEPEPAPA